MSFANEGAAFQASTIIGNVNTSSSYHHSHNYCNTTSTSDGILFRVKRPEINFTGRTSELNEMQQSFSMNEETTIVVCGMGGVGKTQLARKFIEQNKSQFNNCIWIRAESTETLHSSFRELSKNKLRLTTLDANGKEMDFESIIEQVLELLYQKRTLFVYDNVDVMTGAMRFVLSMLPPADGEKPKILITSRIGQWCAGIKVVQLRVWNECESVEYIEKTLIDTRSDSDTFCEMESLAKILQHFPLVLRQATAFIKEQRRIHGKFELTQFIERFNRQTREMLNDDKFRRHSISEYDKTTYTTWLITMEEIEKDKVHGALAIRILRISSYFYLDHINREIFYGLPTRDESQQISKFNYGKQFESVDIAVDLLMKYCMVDNVWMMTFSIHRLVRLVTKLWLEETNEVESTLRGVLHVCSDNMTQIEMRSQAMLILKLVFSLPDPVRSNLINEFSSMPPTILKRMLDIEGYIDEEILKEFANPIEEQYRTVMGPCHRDVLQFKYCVWMTKKLSTKKLNALIDIHAKQKEHFGEVDRDTLHTQYQIARLHFELGNFKEAREMLKKALTMQGNHLKDRDSGIFKEVERLDGKHGKDGAIFAELLKLAREYEKQDRGHLAAQLFDIVVEQQKTFLGESDSATVETMKSLFNAHLDAGNLEAALQLFKESFEVLGKCVKELNIVTERSMDKNYMALRMSQIAFKELEKTSGEDHYESLVYLLHIAYAHYEFKNIHLALQLYEIAFEKRETAHLEQHDPDILESIMYSIAIFHVELKNNGSAIQWLRDAIEQVRKPSTRGDDPSILKCTLVKILATAKSIPVDELSYDVQLALLGLCEHIFETLKIFLGENDFNTLDTMCKMITVHTKLKNHGAAFQLLQDIFKRNSSSSLRKTFLRTCTNELKNNESALVFWEFIVEKHKALLVDYHPYTIEIMYETACVHSRLKNNDAAFELFQQIFEIQSISGGSNDRLIGTQMTDDIILYVVGVIQDIDETNHDLALRLYEYLLQKHQNYPQPFILRRIADLIYKKKDNDFLIQSHTRISEKLQTFLDDRSSVDGMYAIARVYGSMGTNDRAIEWYRKAFDNQIEQADGNEEYENENQDGSGDKVDIGEEYFPTEKSLGINVEASFHINEGNYDLAIRLYRMVYENICSAENKRDATENLCDLAHAYALINDHDLAMKFYEKAFQNETQNNPFNSISTTLIDRIYDTTSVQIEKGNYDFALRLDNLFLKGLCTEENYDGIHGYGKFDHTWKIAHLCAKLNKNDLAAKFYRLSSECGLTCMVVSQLFNEEALYHISKGNNFIALRLYEIIFEKQKKHLSEHHHETIRTMSNIAKVQNMLQDKNMALNNYRNVLEKQKSVRGEFHTDTINTMYALASLNEELGNDLSALQIYRKLFELQKFLKGDTDPNTCEVASHIASIQEKVVEPDDITDNLENYISNAYPVEFQILQRNSKQRAYMSSVDDEFAQFYVAKLFELDLNVSTQDLCSGSHRESETFINERRINFVNK